MPRGNVGQGWRAWRWACSTAAYTPAWHAACIKRGRRDGIGRSKGDEIGRGRRNGIGRAKRAAETLLSYMRAQPRPALGCREGAGGCMHGNRGPKGAPSLLERCLVIFFIFMSLSNLENQEYVGFPYFANLFLGVPFTKF